MHMRRAGISLRRRVPTRIAGRTVVLVERESVELVVAPVGRREKSCLVGSADQLRTCRSLQRQ